MGSCQKACPISFSQNSLLCDTASSHLFFPLEQLFDDTLFELFCFVLGLGSILIGSNCSFSNLEYLVLVLLLQDDTFLIEPLILFLNICISPSSISGL